MRTRFFKSITTTALLLYALSCFSQIQFFDKSSSTFNPKFVFHENQLYDGHGKHVGLVSGDAIYDLRGNQFLWYKFGKLYDLNGYVVAESYNSIQKKVIPVLEQPQIINPVIKRNQPVFQDVYARYYFQPGEILLNNFIQQGSNSAGEIRALNFSQDPNLMLLELAEMNQSLRTIQQKKERKVSNRIFQLSSQFSFIELNKQFDADFATQASEVFSRKFNNVVENRKMYSIEEVENLFYRYYKEMLVWNSKIILLKNSVALQIDVLKRDFSNLAIDWIKFQYEVLDSSGLYTSEINENGILLRRFKESKQIGSSSINYAKIIWESHGEDFLRPPPFFKKDPYEYVSEIRVALVKQQGYRKYFFIKDSTVKNTIYDSIKVWGNYLIKDKQLRSIYDVNTEMLLLSGSVDSVLNILESTNPEARIILKYILKQKLTNEKKASEIFNSVKKGNRIDGYKESFTSIKNQEAYNYELKKYMTELYAGTSKFIDFSYLSKKLEGIKIKFVKNEFFTDQELQKVISDANYFKL